MDLLLDAGNTRLKWGLHDGAGWRGQGAVALGLQNHQHLVLQQYMNK